jgi:hypothetical protein
MTLDGKAADQLSRTGSINLQRPRLIVEVLVFASSHERPFAYNSYCRVSQFRVRHISLNDRDTHSGTGVSFSPIPDGRFI